jgi:two-component system, LytTR family, response regulator
MTSNTFNEKDTLDRDESILILSHTNGKDFIKIDTIVHCEAEGFLSNIHLNNGNKHTVSILLNKILEKLPAHKFIKIAPTHFVNVDFVNRFIKDKSSYVEMHDGLQIAISKDKERKLKEFLYIF